MNDNDKLEARKKVRLERKNSMGEQGARYRGSWNPWR